MTRISKQNTKRAVSPKRPALPGKKTGPKKDALSAGYKLHESALPEELASQFFIPKIKNV